MGSMRRREPGKLQAIVQGVRERIIRGELSLGAPLTYRLLQREYQSGMATVQAAVKVLVNDGFLLTKARQGTCVSHTPPHLCTYGVSFHTSSPMIVPPDGTFQSVFAHVCQARQHAGTRLNLYFQVTHDPGQGDYSRLLADIQNHRLAGLIFPGTQGVVESIVAATPSLPTTSALCHWSAQQMPGCVLDQYSFVDKALDYLAAKGRRKIAMVLTQMWPELDGYLQAGLHARDMIMQPLWRFDVSAGAGAGPLISTATSLLMISAGEHPDGMIIWDDIFVEYVVKGLLAIGARIGTDLDLVAHCNYPLSRPDQVPLKRLGFDARQILDHAIRFIDLQRAGKPAPAQVDIPALFEEEVQPITAGEYA